MIKVLLFGIVLLMVKNEGMFVIWYMVLNLILNCLVVIGFEFLLFLLSFEIFLILFFEK